MVPVRHWAAIADSTSLRPSGGSPPFRLLISTSCCPLPPGSYSSMRNVSTHTFDQPTWPQIWRKPDLRQDHHHCRGVCRKQGRLQNPSHNNRFHNNKIEATVPAGVLAADSWCPPARQATKCLRLHADGHVQAAIQAGAVPATIVRSITLSALTTTFDESNIIQKLVLRVSIRVRVRFG